MVRYVVLSLALACLYLTSPGSSCPPDLAIPLPILVSTSSHHLTSLTYPS